MAAVVLAAGAGTRLRPLTSLRPKPLCPVANRPLVDHAVARARRVTDAVAVNVHHGRAQLEAHLAGDGAVHVSVEVHEALGTAGALGHLAPWIDGRPTLVQNADAWTNADLASFVEAWDGERIRVLVVPGADGRARFGPGVGLVASLLPWSAVARLAAVPSGLYEVLWRQAAAEGRLDVVGHPGAFVDCGSLADYLRANRLAAAADARADGTGSLVDPGAEVTGHVESSVLGDEVAVAGSVTRSVVWPGSRVANGEVLVDAVRAGRLTVAVR